MPNASWSPLKTRATTSASDGSPLPFMRPVLGSGRHAIGASWSAPGVPLWLAAGQNSLGYPQVGSAMQAGSRYEPRERFERRLGTLSIAHVVRGVRQLKEH